MIIGGDDTEGALTGILKVHRPSVLGEDAVNIPEYRYPVIVINIFIYFIILFQEDTASNDDMR